MLLCRLNITFTYSMPAVGEERGKKINATQVAVLKVMQRGPRALHINVANAGDLSVRGFHQ